MHVRERLCLNEKSNEFELIGFCPIDPDKSIGGDFFATSPDESLFIFQIESFISKIQNFIPPSKEGRGFISIPVALLDKKTSFFAEKISSLNLIPTCVSFPSDFIQIIGSVKKENREYKFICIFDLNEIEGIIQIG